MNKTLAFLISNDFCFKSQQAGTVLKIDKVNKVAILQYDDGTKDAIDLDDKLNKNSGMGYYIHQLFKIVYAEGERFEKGDVIAYNPSFFTGKGKNIDYLPGTLAKVAIAAGDYSFEDSTIVSESLVHKCSSKINKLKQCVLGKNTEIHKIVKVGDHVETGDSLIEYTESFEDEDAADLLKQLTSQMSDEERDELVNSEIPAKVGGDITRIEIFYNCPFEELSESLQRLVREYRTKLENRARIVQDIHTDNVHVPPLTQTTNKKIKKEEFPEGGGVIIDIYTEYLDPIGRGDKIVFYTALKGVISNVMKKEESPLCDYRPEEPIEAILTPTGVISRMTSDIYSSLFGNKVLVELGKQIREIWEG